jgi:hypothetical protein
MMMVMIGLVLLVMMMLTLMMMLALVLQTKSGTHLIKHLLWKGRAIPIISLHTKHLLAVHLRYG